MVLVGKRLPLLHVPVPAAALHPLLLRRLLKLRRDNVNELRMVYDPHSSMHAYLLRRPLLLLARVQLQLHPLARRAWCV